LAKERYDKVYNPLFVYDLVLNTGKLTPDESAERILACIEQNNSPQGFLASAIAWQKRIEANSDSSLDVIRVISMFLHHLWPSPKKQGFRFAFLAVKPRPQTRDAKDIITVPEKSCLHLIPKNRGRDLRRT
jgi:hypothetical protein